MGLKFCLGQPTAHFKVLQGVRHIAQSPPAALPSTVCCGLAPAVTIPLVSTFNRRRRQIPPPGPRNRSSQFQEDEFPEVVNLVASDCEKYNYTLRRIDMSRFFLPTKDGDGRSLLGRDPPQVEEDCRLPEATMNFYPPQRTDSHGKMDFMLLKNKNKLVATNEKRHALMYDPDMPAFYHVPKLIVHRDDPISIAVGNNLYLLDRQQTFNTNGNVGCRSFEALVYRPLIPQQHGWEWRSLPPMPAPPFVTNGDTDRNRTWVTSLAAVQGGRRRGTHIWVSATAMDGGGGACTYSFDTRRRVWSSPADWSLPFCGVPEYVPELHGLWCGISSREHGSVLCASDLAAASGFSHEHCRRPPVLHQVFDDDVAGSPKEGWHLVTSHAVHLGSGKFCIARFFERTRYVECFQVWDNCVVFAGVEVLSCDGKLHMVKHRSERYMFLHEELQDVL